MEPTVPADRVSDDHDARITQAVEALVFASDVPLRNDDLARAYSDVTGSDVTPEDISRAVERLNADYRAGGRAFRVEAFGGGYRLATVPELAPFVRSLFEREEERRLSRSLLETLAVIAYKQPATKPEVEHVRGVSSDYALRQLLERGFVDVVGRADSIGRPLLYGTTDRFLDQFGLATLEDLPSPREVEEILSDPRFSRERAQLLAEWAADAQADGAPGASGDDDGSGGREEGGPSAPEASGAEVADALQAPEPSPEAVSSEPISAPARAVVSSEDTPDAPSDG
ncbi:SMC-Scp complex subunit ScpB [Rubricoccus marinus]|uniref:SMC-Scp complex subunit ScpB n=1 Tax=Rubricoccus marinus TaxID=716817 RepID=A0A259TYL8_9BACT|nr:SMC-Scp complex subunit ScpB [Rubricoccus marinus]OZC02790.1 SMC-Scp complex subunit ScpB [Rubricoccus marinus]